MTAIIRGRSFKIIVAMLAALGLFAGGAAVASHYAGHVTFSGGGVVQTKVATDTNGWGSSANNTWQSITGTGLTVSVPSGSARLITARFNAESSCTATAWCVVRIVARKSGSSTVTELHPRVGTEFAFDAPSGEAYEGTSVHRSIRLGSGTWTIFAQGYVQGTSGSMYVDDWHFEVSAHTSS